MTKNNANKLIEFLGFDQLCQLEQRSIFLRDQGSRLLGKKLSVLACSKRVAH